MELTSSADLLRQAPQKERHVAVGETDTGIAFESVGQSCDRVVEVRDGGWTLRENCDQRRWPIIERV